MTRALALLLAALALLLPPAVAAQSGARVVASVSWVEEWDPAAGRWVRVEDAPATVTPALRAAAVSTTRQAGAYTVTETITEQPARFLAAPRLVASTAPGTGALAAFGPFRVLDSRRAALVGTTDAASPQAFAAMIANFPGLEVLEFVDAPGTRHDLANLRLGRAIRAAGLATHVPAGGSARSGAVELFLAGTRRTIAPGALFAVHSWRDERGREPADFAPDAPENRLYTDYYTEMGMTADQARAFYAMTNSVPHAGARWLEGEEMARWIAPAARPAAAAPLLAAETEAALRRALARSAGTLAQALAAGRGRPQVAFPALVPPLAHAGPGAGLLDSQAAFP